MDIINIRMNTPTLKTERLILRKFTKKDIEALFLILKEPSVSMMKGMLQNTDSRRHTPTPSA